MQGWCDGPADLRAIRDLSAMLVADGRSLSGVRWIGGGSGAGKTTVARRLAAVPGTQIYDTDDAMSDHARRLGRAEAPRLHRFLRMSMDQRWVSRSPTVMLESFHWFAGEGFDLLVGDVRSSAPRGPIVVEGFRLLPRLVAPLLEDPRDAVRLLPTPELRRIAFESRGSLWTIAGATSDPQRALDNLLERDRLFTELLREETARLGLVAIDVDVDVSEEQVAALVIDHLRPFGAG